MDRVKEIIVKVIPANIANDFVKKHHYSGKVVPNSNLHFGAFLDNKLHGVMSYGPSLCKANMLGIVEGTKWNEFIELNRMAFDDYLPRNSESFCIARSLKMIKKNAPQIKWVVPLPMDVSAETAQSTEQVTLSSPESSLARISTACQMVSPILR